MTRETGCLRVMRVAELRPFGMPPNRLSASPWRPEPGDVVVFHEDLLHASFGGQPDPHQGRCQFHRPAGRTVTSISSTRISPARPCSGSTSRTPSALSPSIIASGSRSNNSVE